MKTILLNCFALNCTQLHYMSNLQESSSQLPVGTTAQLMFMIISYLTSLFTFVFILPLNLHGKTVQHCLGHNAMCLE